MKIIYYFIFRRYIHIYLLFGIDFMSYKKICVIGLGYIGLPTCGIFSTNNIKVHGVDVIPEVVDTVNNGKVHIFEPYLESMIKNSVEKGVLKADTKPDYADAFLICVPTPLSNNNKPDLSYVEQATEAIIPYLKKGNLVVLESTSPPGTTNIIASILENNTKMMAGNDFFVAYCPERVLPGFILKELVENDRNIGGINWKSSEKAKELYRIFVTGDIYLTDSITAEMSKLIENTYRDINIAFANELSIICDKLSIDVFELIKLANRHPRVNIHQPGAGVGGHCIAVDPYFIVDKFKDESLLIKTAREVNRKKPEYIFNKVLTEIDNKKRHVDNVTVGCFGVSYKADIEDIKESPALKIVINLIESDVCEVLVCDPYIYKSDYVKKSLRFDVYNNPVEVINKSDIILLLVDHRQFKDIDQKKLNGKTIIDTRGIWKRIN